MRAAIGCVVAAACIALCVGCTSTRTPRQVQTLVQQVERARQGHQALGEELAAARLERLLARFADPTPAPTSADPGPGLVEWPGGDVPLAGPPPGADRWEPDDPWGVNRAPRVGRRAGAWRRVVLWLPDRVLDVLDLVSVDARIGWGLLADVHVTRGGSLAAGGAGTLGLGWHERRMLGVRVTSSAGWRAGPLGAGFDLGFDAGSGERRSGAGRREPGFDPTDLLWQEWRDPWAVGVELQLVIAGASVDLHPLQLVDLLAGIVGLDPGRDDLATTEAQPLDPAAQLDAQALRECLADEATMAAWWGRRSGRDG